jgi:hypothetical protein
MSLQALTADGKKVGLVTATGPSTAVSVSAGTAANVDLPIATPPFIIQEILSLKSIAGLPDGIVLVGVSYPNLSTVRVRVFNPTAAGISITANSVTASILVQAV